MASIPTPVIAAVSPIAYTETDQDIVLDGTGSIKGDAASVITGYSWSIFHRSPGLTVGNCYLTGATTSTPTLRYPGGIAGSVGIILNITDDNPDVDLRNSYPNHYPSQNGADAAYGKGAYAVIGPVRTQVLFVSMLTPANLMLPAEGHRGWFPPTGGYHDLVRRVSTLATGAVTASRTVFVQAHAGDADADGSMLRPFNPTSAAANTNPFTGLAYVGPWAQAQVALLNLDISDVPGAPRTIVALGNLDEWPPTANPSAYDEDVTIDADGPYNIIAIGKVHFAAGRTFTYEMDGAALAPPSLSIGGWGAGGNRNFYVPTLRFKNTAGIVADIQLEGVGADAVSVLDSFAAGPYAYFRNCYFGTGHFNVPDLDLRSMERVDFAGNLIAKVINSAERCSFGGDVTVTVAATDGYDHGFHACSFDGATPEFDGPAGSALFDGRTAEQFESQGGTYASGAGVSDHLNISSRRVRAKQELRTPAIYDNGGSGNLSVNADNILSLVAAQIWAASGPSLGLASVYDWSIRADDSAGNKGGIHAFLPESPFLLEIFTQGSGKGISIYTGDGTIRITANGAGRGVIVSADDDGDVTLQATGTDRTVVMRGGTGADARVDIIERDTDNGGVIVRGRGTHGYDLKSDIIESNLVQIRADGAAGTSGRAIVSIASDSTEAVPAGTTLEVLKTYTLAASTMLTDGGKLYGTAYFRTAGNANDKRMYLRINGGAVATIDETDAPFNNTWVRFEFEIWKTSNSNELRVWWKATWGTGKAAAPGVEQMRDAAAVTLSSSVAIEIAAHAPTANTDIVYVASELRYAAGLVGA